MKEHYYDKLLNVKTSGYEKEYDALSHNHPYEPTEYHVLEILLERYAFNQVDCLVDFGAGKGRLCFFLHYFQQIAVKGIEMDAALYEQAIKNKKKYIRKTKKDNENLQFYHTLAEAYEIDRADNRFYFFNPFSVQIFMKIIQHILLSLEKSPREVELILYYASEDFVYYLENNTPFQLKQEMIVPWLYDNNPYERFSIYYLPFV